MVCVCVRARVRACVCVCVGFLYLINSSVRGLTLFAKGEWQIGARGSDPKPICYPL